MHLFRPDNTDGYTPAELDALNAEWEEYVLLLDLDEGTSEYEQHAKQFCDEVARR